MNHSLIIDEVLAHPQDVSWLPWAVQYFFFIVLFSLKLLKYLKIIGRPGESDAANRPDLRDYRAAGADC
mgnify:CR=1 FL=1